MLTPRWTPITEQGEVRLTGARLQLWLDSVPRPHLPTCTDDVCDAGCRYGTPRIQHACVDAGRQSLKTELMAKRLPVLYLTIRKRWPDPRYLYCAPTDDQSVTIVWEDWKALVPEDWLDEKDGISESRHRIKTKWNTELWCKGVDKPQRVEGKSWDGIVRDESADQKENVWGKHLAPLIVARDGWSRHIGTPDFEGTDARNYREMCEQAERGLKRGWKRYTWPSADVIPPEIVAELSESMTALEVRQEFYADWISAPGRAFYEYSKERHVKPTEFLPGKPLRITCDFNNGYHNWGIAQCTQHETGKPFYRFVDQVYLQSAPTLSMCQELRRLIRSMAGDGADAYLNAKGMLWFYGDWSGNQKRSESPYTNWEQIQSEFPNAIVAARPSGPIKSSLEMSNVALSNYRDVVRVQVDPRCTNLITDLEYVTRAMLYSAEKTGELTHCADYFRYLISQYDGDNENDAVDLDALGRMLMG
jgi:hypothetical protein